MTKKKLTKSSDKIVSGVFGGIAEYFGWSPNLTRILFVIISSASAAVPGILVYLVLWLIMPKATAESYV